MTRWTVTACRLQRRGHRIDEERHVVIDDLDDRVTRVPAIGRGARIESPQLRLSRLALLRELPERQRRAVEILCAAADEIVGRDMIVELRDETLDEDGIAGAQARCREARNRCEDRLFFFVRALRHG